MTETDHFESGFATLSTDSIDYQSDAPYKISGVAIPVNTIVNGGQDVDHFFPEEVLQEAKGLLDGKPIVKNFHELKGQASADDVIGQVTQTGYQQGVGLVFEGEITDKDIAQKIAQGYLDVSPSPARSLGAYDESMGAQRVDRLVDFRDLAVVANGQPGAKVEAGGNPAVEALARDALSRGFDFDTLESDMTPPSQAQTNAQAVLDIRDKTDAMTETGWTRANQLADGEELSADVIQKMAQFNRHQSNTEYENFSDIPDSKKSEDAENPWWEDNGTVAWLGWGGRAGVDWAINKSEEMDTNEADTLESDMKTVAGVSFRGTRDGELDESEIPNDDYESHYLYPADTKTDSSYPVVDGEGYLRKGNVDSAWRLGARGDVDDEDHDRRLMELAGEFDSPPEWAVEDMDTQSDDPEGASSAATESTETMSKNDLSDDEKAVLRAAEDVEDAVDVLGEYAAAEQPAIVESDALEAKDEQLEEFADVFRDALKNEKGLKDETVNAMSVDALASEFTNEDGELEVETLSQSPETQTPSKAPEEDGEKERLTRSEREELDALERRIKLLDGRAEEEHVDALRSEAADLAGVDEYDDIEMEVL